jgi:hypothetical protein
MKNTMMTVVSMTILTMASVSEVMAQGPPPATRGFANVNIGFQPTERTFSISNSFPIYGETATLSTGQEVGGGALFDISGGYRIRENLGVGIGFTAFSDTGASTGTVSIPDPLVFNRPVTVPISADNLDHSEQAVHILVTWFVPITNEFDIAVSAGPAFFSVSQDLVASVNIPTATQTATPVVTSEDESAVGFTFAVDGTYLVMRNVGVGAFLRYSGAKVDLPSVPDLSVGGFQVGFGARLRF